MKKIFPNLMLVGIQGSGKGTQAQLLVEKFGYKLFDTGAELRKIAQTDTDLGKKVNALVSRGERVPPKYLRDTIENFLQKNKDFPIIFDGPIRSREQDIIIRPILGKYIILHFILDPKIAIERLTMRRIDPETGEIFSHSYHGDTNPKTGNKLITRPDDNEDAIKKRIQWSIDEYIPLIHSWEKSGQIVHEIDSNNSIENIFETLTNIINSYTK